MCFNVFFPHNTILKIVLIEKWTNVFLSVWRLAFSLELSATNIAEHRLYLQEVCWFASRQKKPHWISYIYYFNVHGSVHRKVILIYVQQDAKLHSLFYMETALHISGGTTTYHQERKQLYLQHLVFVTPLLLPAAIVEEVELQSIYIKKCKITVQSQLCLCVNQLHVSAIHV
jgi:hypothetical protein